MKFKKYKIPNDGLWLDMNEPATGSGVLDKIRFNGGQYAHQNNHNQYALGMQMASREGLVRRNPHLRPFLLSRSGFIGTSRYSQYGQGITVPTITISGSRYPSP